MKIQNMMETLMEIEATIARNIRRIRLEKGLTQEKLARKCGMQISYIGMIEIRKKNPKLSTLQRIARGLDVHYLELLKPPEDDFDCEIVSELFDPVETASREIHKVLQKHFYERHN
ncbi:MAG: helix-turn-helix transcriptional regulator [Sphaerochaetaceae bacterium]|nr:helix-turn-helix transcriptional regulator [Sphaerochaetaceae bacterium]NLO61693.1 helix-turn-helix transcriptional regulator [Spirochaetales bacterium]MDD2406570.1 helix-turn-helix transcriptional regulator [Sphaerochaetaceae bacterium]MDD3670596.1 helix-turn-helix transcriptional regulator [Sphaerochaetaceae bacterium]MDD4259040.1 helix-turn-helix transcriptional regulator [Sphaerochaetaceae bacterium]